MPSADYERIVDLLPSEPVDYWDFPSCVLAFGESLRGSSLARLGNCLFRKRGAEYTLITWNGEAAEMEAVYCSLAKRRGVKVKSLCWCEEKLRGVGEGRLRLEFAKRDFYLTDGYDFSFARKSKRTRARNRNALRDGAELLAVDVADRSEEERAEVLRLFGEWREWAKTRHFMVFIGHYLAWLRRYYAEPNNCELRIYRERATSRVVGIYGFERVGSTAQELVLKHVDLEAVHLARYIRLEGIRRVLDGGTRWMSCGTDSDELKDRIGMESRKAYRLKARA